MRINGAVTTLVEDLSSANPLTRHQARHALVAIGSPAVAPLMALLADAPHMTRWEAVKALGELGDPAGAPALVSALDDEAFDIRYLAAEGLVQLREEGLPPLLRALARRPTAIWLREGAHYVLRNLHTRGSRSHLAGVLAALEDFVPVIRLQVATQDALDELKPRRQK